MTSVAHATVSARNIVDPKGHYRWRQANAPSSATIPVTLTQLIIVRNLGFKITSSDIVKAAFDKKVKKDSERWEIHPHFRDCHSCGRRCVLDYGGGGGREKEKKRKQRTSRPRMAAVACSR